MSSSREPGRPDEVKILGVEFDYDMRGAECDRATLVELLTAAGFAGSIPRRPPTVKRALRRAIAAWASGRAGTAFSDDDERGDIVRRKQLIREIRGQAERGQAAPTIYALVEEASLGNQLGLKYATSYRFHYRPDVADSDADAGVNVGALRVTTTAYGEIASGERLAVEEEIRPLWDRYKGLYLGADLSTVVIDIIHSLRGISVQSGSGVWFIPADQLDAVDRLEALIKQFAPVTGTPPSVRIRENIDWPRTRAALSEAALDAIVSEVRQAEQSLERFEAQADEKPGSVKITSVSGLVQDLLRVKQKALFYEETVGLRAERLVGDLTALGRRALTLTKANQAAREQRIGATPFLPAVPTPPAALPPTPAAPPVDLTGTRERRLA